MPLANHGVEKVNIRAVDAFAALDKGGLGRDPKKSSALPGDAVFFSILSVRVSWLFRPCVQFNCRNECFHAFRCGLFQHLGLSNECLGAVT
jgi:hypothetical protein